MVTLTHKDYTAQAEFDPDSGLYHGEVANARAVLTFQGRTIDELKQAFAETIEIYEEWCRERGKEDEALSRAPADRSPGPA